ncbi:hypothetical protein Pla144_23320 [Bythopirellula polymerisocia]|uniref:Uncharacterized protein n=1 Tax=Bythopirellula polymerisocia TaxID=2528003 RepID=A0A5C6CUM5_9BACT|nr:hypothetical protein Pla144_23320 [Bythopirellula polymerisocia]
MNVEELNFCLSYLQKTAKLSTWCPNPATIINNELEYFHA